MPSIILNRKVFDKLVGKRYPDKILKDRISYLGTDLERLDSDEIVVEIFPNRPDMLSEQGFARAFSSFMGTSTGLKRYAVNKSGYLLVIEGSVKSVRPCTACAVVKGLSFSDERIREVIQIQEKLHIGYGRNRKKVAIGLYPFDKIRMPIRYLAKRPSEIRFRPLDSSAELSAMQILAKHPAGKEYGHLLEGKGVFPLFIDADDTVLSMPPIINSEAVGRISSTTKDVFIECSGFDYPALSRCLNIIVCALADMGGRVYSVEIADSGKTIRSPVLEPATMKLDMGYVNKRLGLDLKEAQIKKLLEQMGFGYSSPTVYVPAYRADIMHMIDLVEDIAIAYGYENLVPEFPRIATVGSEDRLSVFKRRISDILSGLGLMECKSFHLTSRPAQTGMMGTELGLIELSNAINADYSVLVAWVIPLLMEVLKGNKHHGYPQMIYAASSVFSKDNSKDTGVLEQERLACVLCSESSDYTKALQVLDYLFRMLSVKYAISEASHPSFIAGRVGRVSIRGKKIAYIGEIAPAVLEKWSLDVPVSGFELNLTELFGLMNDA